MPWVRTRIYYTGVYLLRNGLTGDIYVGAAILLLSRLKTHLRQCREGRHPNPRIQASFNQCGEEHFTFTVLELCAPGVHRCREDAWIAWLQPTLNQPLGRHKGPQAPRRKQWRWKEREEGLVCFSPD